MRAFLYIPRKITLHYTAILRAGWDFRNRDSLQVWGWHLCAPGAMWCRGKQPLPEMFVSFLPLDTSLKMEPPSSKTWSGIISLSLSLSRSLSACASWSLCYISRLKQNLLHIQTLSGTTVQYIFRVQSELVSCERGWRVFTDQEEV